MAKEQRKGEIGEIAVFPEKMQIVKIVDNTINSKNKKRLIVEFPDGHTKSYAAGFLAGSWHPETMYAELEKEMEQIRGEEEQKKQKALENQRQRLQKLCESAQANIGKTSEDGYLLVDVKYDEKTPKIIVYVADEGDRETTFIKKEAFYNSRKWKSEEEWDEKEKALKDAWKELEKFKAKGGIEKLYSDTTKLYQKEYEDFANGADKSLFTREYDEYAWNQTKTMDILDSKQCVRNLLNVKEEKNLKQEIRDNFSNLSYDEFSGPDIGIRLDTKDYSIWDENANFGEFNDISNFRFDACKKAFLQLEPFNYLAVIYDGEDSRSIFFKDFGIFSNLEEIKDAARAVLNDTTDQYNDDFAWQLRDDLSDVLCDACCLDIDTYHIEERINRKLEQELFEEEYLPELVEQYEEEHLRLAEGKSTAKKSWEDTLKDYQSKNSNKTDNLLFAALSAMHVLNHVAKSLQDTSNSVDQSYNLLLEQYGSQHEIYSLKNDLLHYIYENYPEHVKLAAVIPCEPDKYFVNFCDYHFDMFREERSLLQCGPMDYYWENNAEINSCSKCSVTVNKNYYSMYNFDITLPEADFSFHEPFPIGRGKLPALDTLPHVDQEFNDEGMFLFGREASLDESDLALAVDLTTPIKELLNNKVE